jgi:hypothetical protein
MTEKWRQKYPERVPRFVFFCPIRLRRQILHPMVYNRGMELRAPAKTAARILSALMLITLLPIVFESGPIVQTVAGVIAATVAIRLIVLRTNRRGFKSPPDAP